MKLSLDGFESKIHLVNILLGIERKLKEKNLTFPNVAAQAGLNLYSSQKLK